MRGVRYGPRRCQRSPGISGDWAKNVAGVVDSIPNSDGDSTSTLRPGSSVDEDRHRLEAPRPEHRRNTRCDARDSIMEAPGPPGDQNQRAADRPVTSSAYASASRREPRRASRITISVCRGHGPFRRVQGGRRKRARPHGPAPLPRAPNPPLHRVPSRSTRERPPGTRPVQARLESTSKGTTRTTTEKPKGNGRRRGITDTSHAHGAPDRRAPARRRRVPSAPTTAVFPAA